MLLVMGVPIGDGLGDVKMMQVIEWMMLEMMEGKLCWW